MEIRSLLAVEGIFTLMPDANWRSHSSGHWRKRCSYL